VSIDDDMQSVDIDDMSLDIIEESIDDMVEQSVDDDIMELSIMLDEASCARLGTTAAAMPPAVNSAATTVRVFFIVSSVWGCIPTTPS
jgi:hypothetical protein